MKKTLKFAWMMLFCLSASLVASCSKDDEPNNNATKPQVPALFEDYSGLLTKSPYQVIEIMGEDPYNIDSATDDYVFQLSEGNITDVEVIFTDDVDSNDAVAEQVNSYLIDDLEEDEVVEYLENLYGEYDYDEEDNMYGFASGNMFIGYFPYENETSYLSNYVMYIDATRAGNMMEALKAAKLRVRK